ncbi:SPOR domain-containing protein [Acidocella sp.]|uniref:SPOR domain-containing protein n=1 Tax=Acidocella sp. TaxID=50710 RepID=UPI003CFC33DB
MALSISQSILKDDPNNVDALVHEGDAYYALGRCLPAQAAYQLALKYDAKSSRAETGLGRCLLKTDPAAAEQAFMAAVQADPGNAAAWSDLGVARDLQGNFQGAVEPYQKSLLANPASIATEVNLGLSLALSGHGPEALQYLGPLATGQSATPKIRQDYAAALIASGRDQEARNVLAVDLPPDQIQQAMDGFSELIASSIQHPAPPPPPAPTQPAVVTPTVTSSSVPVSAAPTSLMPAAMATPTPAMVTPPPISTSGDPDAAYTGPSPIPGAISSSMPGPTPTTATSVSSTPKPSMVPPTAHGSAPVAVATPVPEASSGPAMVQLGALNSEAAAKLQWRKISAAEPVLFKGKSPDIQQADVKGQTYYRLRVGGFTSKLAAARFCGEVSSAGYACTVADF